MLAAILRAADPTVEYLPRKKFTRAEVDRLTDLGVLDGERYELIDGDLINKMGQSPAHMYAIVLIQEWLGCLFGIQRLWIQGPIAAGSGDRERSVPEPDLAVLKERKPEYGKRLPCGDELVIAVEVAESSVRFDLGRKSQLYAAAGVPEYWVVDLTRRQIVVHRQSDGSIYRLIQFFAEDDTVKIENREEGLRVGDVLPAED